VPFAIGAIGNARWAGARLASLLEETGILEQGTEVIFWGADRGTVTIRDNVGILSGGQTGVVEPDTTGSNNQKRRTSMRKLMLIVIAAVAIVAVVSGGAVSADSEKEVKVKGSEDFEPNALFKSNFRFAPGDITVHSGDTVTWIDKDKLSVPHTITIVDPEDLPVDFATAYLCLGADIIPGVDFDGRCLPFLAAHGGLAFSTPVVNVGDAGVDVPGDSLFLPPDGSVSEQVTAAPGTTLHYMCILHPWMQGTITVE
jgi:plastocyanin